MSDRFMVHLDEVRPSLGTLDYGVLLHDCDRLDHDVPLLMEHLPTEAEYDEGAAYIRAVAHRGGIALLSEVSTRSVRP